MKRIRGKIHRSVFILLFVLLAANQAQAQYIYSLFEQSGMAGQPALTGMRHSNVYRDYELNYLQRNYSFAQDGPQFIGRYIGGEYQHYVGRRVWKRYQDAAGRDSFRYIFNGLAFGVGLYHETEKVEDHSLHYMGDYISASVNARIWNRWGLGLGIQGGRFADLRKDVLDYNAGFVLSYSGSLTSGRYLIWSGPKQLDNYLAVSIYHPDQPFNPRADSSGISSKRIQVSGKLRFYLNRSMNIWPVFNMIYNGRLIYDAGAWLSYRTSSRRDNDVRLGAQFQSTRHLTLMAGRLLIMDDIPDLDLHFAYNIPLGGTERLGYYRPGFEFGISIGGLGGKIIVCQNTPKVIPPMLAYKGGQGQ